MESVVKSYIHRQAICFMHVYISRLTLTSNNSKQSVWRNMNILMVQSITQLIVNPVKI